MNVNLLYAVCETWMLDSKFIIAMCLSLLTGDSCILQATRAASPEINFDQEVEKESDKATEIQVISPEGNNLEYVYIEES